MGELDNLRFIVEGLGVVLVGIFGIIGNISGILWFSRKLIQKNFHQLMLCLALCDLLYVLLSIFLFGLPSIFSNINKTSLYNNLVPVLLPSAQISLTGSIYLTLAIALERYTTVCHPFFKISHLWTARMYILPIFIFAVGYNSPKFFELTVVAKEENTSSISNTSAEVVEVPLTQTFQVGPTSLRLEPLYIKVYLIYSNLIIHGIIPLFLLIFLNIAIYRQIRKVRGIVPGGCLHQREVRLAQVSCGIVAVFIICHSIKWIPNIYELLQVQQGQEVIWPAWVEYVTCVSHLLTTLNSSVNFYIYMFKHFKRRDPRQGSRPTRDSIIELKDSAPPTATPTMSFSWRHSRTSLNNLTQLPSNFDSERQLLTKQQNTIVSLPSSSQRALAPPSPNYLKYSKV